MMRPSFHGYFEPPHERASKRQTTPGRKAAVPGRSICLICPFHPIVLAILFPGAVKKNRMKTAVTPPSGKLMKKHHLQVRCGLSKIHSQHNFPTDGFDGIRSLPVNAPPMSGPATLAIPYIPPIIPVYVGLWCRGTVCATIRIAPEKIPALPSPATALPMIRAVDDGATAQTRDPSSNRPRAIR
jgi:hypothetical protein